MLAVVVGVCVCGVGAVGGVVVGVVFGVGVAVFGLGGVAGVGGVAVGVCVRLSGAAQVGIGNVVGGRM